MDSAAESSLPRQQVARFATTHWTLVLRAGDRADKASDEALAALCGQYWQPLYAYMRRCVTDVNEAQDLTQAFFVRLLDKNTLAHASPDRGRFRSFLLATAKNFLANERDRSNAEKRGGGRSILSLDFEAADSRLDLQPADESTPDLLFERQWALTLLEVVLARVRAEYTDRQKAAQFEHLKGFLTGGGDGDVAEAVRCLGMTPGAVKVAAHRLRRCYRAQLRIAIAETVATPAEVDDEIQRLFATLAQSPRKF